MSTEAIIALISLGVVTIGSMIGGVAFMFRELRVVEAEQSVKRHDLRNEMTTLHTKLEFRVDRVERSYVEKSDFNALETTMLAKLDTIIEFKQQQAVAMAGVQSEMKHLTTSVNALSKGGAA